MKVKIKDLHPSQLYLSEKKLQEIQMLYHSVESQVLIQSVFLHLEIAC